MFFCQYCLRDQPVSWEGQRDKIRRRARKLPWAVLGNFQENPCWGWSLKREWQFLFSVPADFLRASWLILICSFQLNLQELSWVGLINGEADTVSNVYWHKLGRERFGVSVLRTRHRPEKNRKQSNRACVLFFFFF